MDPVNQQPQQQQQQQTMPAIGQAPLVQYGNQQQQYPTNQPQPPQQYAQYQQQQQQPNNFQQNIPMPQNNANYLQNIANQTQKTNAVKTSIEDMGEPLMSFEEAMDADHRETLMRDYEIIKSMTLLDDDDYLYNLLCNAAAYVSQPFKMNSLSMFYRTKYQELFDRYNSLHIFLEFALSKIIYGSEALLKSACASRVVRLPNSSINEGFKKMFGLRKRSAARASDGTLENVENEVIKRSKNVKHPFLLHPEYLAQPILYNIGKCCDYFIPSEFAELFAHVQHDTVSRILTSSQRVGLKGLKITLTKPIACLLISKSVSTYTFTSLEYLSTLGDILSRMTGLGKLDDTFAFGAKQSMQVESIKTNRIEAFKQNDKFDSGCYVAIINAMHVCKMTNKTLSSKTYANVVYSVPELQMSDDDMDKCNAFIERMSHNVEQSMSKYEDELERIRVETMALVRNVDKDRVLVENGDNSVEKQENGNVNNENGSNSVAVEA